MRLNNRAVDALRPEMPLEGRDHAQRLIAEGAGHLDTIAIIREQALQLLDLMLEHFADDGHWTRGRYDDGNGGHCLVGALLHLSRKHRLPRAPAIALLQDAMPRPGLALVHF